MPKPNTPKLNDTQLVILSSASQRDEAEAETVRTIYRLYQEIRSVDRLKEKIDRSGVRSKLRTGKSDRMSGGRPFSRGKLYRILSNPALCRRDRAQGPALSGPAPGHCGPGYLGGRSGAAQGNRSRAKGPSLLVDERGVKLTSTHAVKNGNCYRYYVSRKDEPGPAWRLPAYEIETAVTSELRAFCNDQERISAALEGIRPSG